MACNLTTPLVLVCAGRQHGTALMDAIKAGDVAAALAIVEEHPKVCRAGRGG